MKYLPMIKCLTSEALNDEDWKDIRVEAGLESIDKDELSLVKTDELGLNKHIERIEEITMMSERKFALAKKLKTQKDEMKVFNLTLFPYKGKTFVMKAIDDVNTKLDD